MHTPFHVHTVNININIMSAPKTPTPERSDTATCCLGSVCFDSSKAAKAPSLTFQSASRRKCTNVLFILLYAGFWAGLIAIVSTSKSQGGNPQKVIHNVDWRGEVCGVSAGVRDRPYSAWVVMPNLANPLEADCTDCYQIRTCIPDCGWTVQDRYVLDKYQSQPLLYMCIPVPAHSVNVHLPNTTFRGEFPYSKYFNSLSEFSSRTYSDLFIGWPVLLLSSLLAIAFSYAYAWLTTKWARVLLGFGVVVITAGGVLISYVLLQNAKQMAATVSTERELAVEILGYTTICLTVLFLCILIALRHRIAIAIEVVREAMTAVRHMKFLVFFPLLPFLVGLGYFVLFVYATLMAGSVWNVQYRVGMPAYLSQRAQEQGVSEFLSPAASYHTYTYNEDLKKSFAFLFLKLLWTIQILTYFVYMVISVAVSRWYFSPRVKISSKDHPERAPKEKKRLPHWPIWDAVVIVLRFHMGTVMCSGLLVAIAQFLRTVAKYFKRLECITGAKNGGNPNCLQVCLANAIYYCSFCSACCLDYINKHALIWTGVYGDEYWIAAKSTFTLLYRNVIRLATVTVVSTYLMTVGKILVAGITAGLGAIITLQYYGTVMNSTILPIVTIFLMAYMVASCFMTTVETVIDTVFVSFLIDEMINGRTGKMCASKRLQDLLRRQSAEAQTALQRAQAEIQQQQQEQQTGGVAVSSASAI